MVTPYNEQSLGNRLNNLYYQMFKNNPKLYDNKYIQMSAPIVQRPIKIPRVEVALIGELVSVIGKDKDKAEVQIYLGEALQKSILSDLKKVELNAKIIEISGYKEEMDTKKMSKEIQKTLRQTELVKRYAEHLKSMND